MNNAHVPSKVAFVIAQVASEHGVTVDLLLSRSAKAAPARHAAMRRIRGMPWGIRYAPSYPLIGRWFGRDHSTVVAACKQVVEETRKPLDADQPERSVAA